MEKSHTIITILQNICWIVPLLNCTSRSSQYLSEFIVYEFKEGGAPKHLFNIDNCYSSTRTKVRFKRVILGLPILDLAQL